MLQTLTDYILKVMVPRRCGLYCQNFRESVPIFKTNWVYSSTCQYLQYNKYVNLAFCQSVSSQQMAITSLSQNLMTLSTLMCESLCSSTQALSFPDITISQTSIFTEYIQDGNVWYNIFTKLTLQ